MKKQFAVRTNDLEFAYDEGREFNIFKIAKLDKEMAKLKEWNVSDNDCIDNQILGVYLSDNDDSDESLEEFNLIGFVKTVRDEDMLTVKELFDMCVKPLTSKCITAKFFDTEENLIPHLLFELEEIVLEETTTVESVDFDDIIEKAIQRVVDEGILSYEECMDRYNTCKEYGVFDDDIVDIFNSMKLYDNTSFIVKKPKVLFAGPYMKKIIAEFNLGEHLAFSGLASTGKNTCVDTISWLYNRPMRTISCSSELDVETIFGRYGFSNGETTRAKGAYTLAMEKGEIIVLDEANTINQSIIPALNSTLDYRGYVDVPDVGMIKGDENFRVIVTFNRNFQGTVDFNEAFNTRFYHKEFNLLDSIEDILKINIPNYDLEKVKLVDRVYKNLLQNIKSTDIKNMIEPTSFSIRGLIRACKVLCYRPFDERESLIEDLTDECGDPDDRVKIIAAIDNALRLAK